MISNSGLQRIIKRFGFMGPLFTILSALFIAFGFYYKTSSTLDDHADSIKEVKRDVIAIKDKINKSDVFQGVSTAEYNALKDKVSEIEKTVDKIDSKIDRVIIQTK